MRLDLALIRRHPQLSRRRARAAIEKGQVTVAGRTLAEAGAEVAEDADLRWDPHRKAEPRARCSLPILHRDDWLVVVDKPAGLLTVPSWPGAAEDTALGRVEDYVRRLRPRRPYVGAVHRIDRDTSGAVAFALDPATRQALRALFRAHRIERRYLALVVGEPRAESGEIALPIGDAYLAGRRRVARPGEPSRPALTRWRVAERMRGAALLELELETGRQHQIRLHLAEVGLPVLGDAVYGGAAAARAGARAPRQMLHARALAFRHPATGQGLRVESPPPEDFLRALEGLRRRR